jgi:hypothetical protein
LTKTRFQQKKKERKKEKINKNKNKNKNKKERKGPGLSFTASGRRLGLGNRRDALQMQAPMPMQTDLSSRPPRHQKKTKHPRRGGGGWQDEK